MDGIVTVEKADLAAAVSQIDDDIAVAEQTFQTAQMSDARGGYEKIEAAQRHLRQLQGLRKRLGERLEG
jgi:hypothetical protein